MKKELKDYLHLYLGCECIYDWPYTMEFNLEGKVTAKIIEEINNPKLTGAVTNVKPILRPLSNMTEEENKYFFGNFGQRAIRIKDFSELYILPSTLLELLSKHFDLFGLIEAGLAVNAAEIKSDSSR